MTTDGPATEANIVVKAGWGRTSRNGCAPSRGEGSQVGPIVGHPSVLMEGRRTSPGGFEADQLASSSPAPPPPPSFQVQMSPAYAPP